MRMRVLPPLAALVLGAATAFLVACGGSDGRIPAGDASRLTSALNQISVDFDAGRCQAAEAAVTKAQGEVVDLPTSVDQKLRDRLESGIRNLRNRIPATCNASQTQTQQQTTTQQTTTQDTQTDENTTSTEQTGTDTTGTDTTGTGTDTTGTDTTTTGTTSTGTTGTGTDGGTSSTGGASP
jgi:hypothetical protein